MNSFLGLYLQLSKSLAFHSPLSFPIQHQACMSADDLCLQLTPILSSGHTRRSKLYLVYISLDCMVRIVPHICGWTRRHLPRLWCVDWTWYLDFRAGDAHFMRFHFLYGVTMKVRALIELVIRGQLGRCPCSMIPESSVCHSCQ
jgi:hypothetical protein